MGIFRGVNKILKKQLNRKWLLIKSLGPAPNISAKWPGWFLTLAGICHCNLSLLFSSPHSGISASNNNNNKVICKRRPLTSKTFAQSNVYRTAFISKFFSATGSTYIRPHRKPVKPRTNQSANHPCTDEVGRESSGIFSKSNKKKKRLKFENMKRMLLGNLIFIVDVGIWQLPRH